MVFPRLSVSIILHAITHMLTKGEYLYELYDTQEIAK